MPGRDGTGPLGRGPYTGRGTARGYRCVGRGERPYYGRGLGKGYYALTDKEDLKEEKKILEERIKYINSQIEKE